MAPKISSRREIAGRVLLVDRDSVFLKTMQDVLKQSFYEVTTCNFLHDALCLLRMRHGGFDIVFSDTNMPDMNITEFLKCVGLKMNSLPIIIMSENAEYLSLMNDIHPRPYDLLLKPIDLEKLFSILKHALPNTKIRNATMIKSHENRESFQDLAAVFSQPNYGIQDMNIVFKQDNQGIMDTRAVLIHLYYVTTELHHNELGNEEIGSKKILEDGITTTKIASDLQEHRLQSNTLQNKCHEEHKIQVDLLQPTASIAAVGGVQSFSQFSYAELKVATNNFISKCIVSERREKAPNPVYKGCLQNGHWIAVKKFHWTSWPDPKQFVEEARGLGKLRHRRLANLIGYCCEGDKRLLVAEFMPNETLAKHLFHGDNRTIEWTMRLRVALYIAEALNYCSNEERPLYHHFNPYKVLFDEDGDPRLSCFGLMKNSWDKKSYIKNLAYTPRECLRTGRVTPESVIYSFGIVLFDLLCGRHIPLTNVFGVILSKSIIYLMDSNLEGKFCLVAARVVVGLAYRCVQSEPRERPNTRDLVTVLADLLQNPI